MSVPRVSIVAALEREVWPIVKHWRAIEREHDGGKFKFFENDRAVVICGGIGKEAARRATEAIICLYEPVAVISVGFAGALDSKLKVGVPVPVRKVIDAADGSRYEFEDGSFTLVTSSDVAGTVQKEKIGKAYGAHAVDMEAAAVAKGAQKHGIPFLTFKAISDEMDFEFPSMQRFITYSGRFQTARFAVFATFRPWLWPKLFQLARNSAKATKTLCGWLDQYNHPVEKLENSTPGLHPILRVR
ncbi:MAG TPA: phosphorylase [Terriglobales bacterium]|nr:phosphorylase [Terriglobales bacterium]